MKYIYFGADWCAPCKTLKPKVLNSNKSIEIKQVENSEKLVSDYQIKSVPTVVGIDSTGNVAERYTGTDAIQSFLN